MEACEGFTERREAAALTTEDLEERYGACAEAEACLRDNGLLLPVNHEARAAAGGDQ